MRPSIPGVDRDVLIAAIHGVLPEGHYSDDCWDAADAAIAHIAANHECACEREHDDEWVEVDRDTRLSQPEGTRMRREWVKDFYDVGRFFVHRDDLPDPDADRIERMTKAIFASNYPNLRWESMGEDTQEHYRRFARAALAAFRDEDGQA